uniref:Transmembrane protein 236-like n=1 Tax=Sinocyclocheilus anshuiensis TaxID=1608454 RepID=A0A671M4I2_9TELE
MLSGKTVKLILYELLQFACLCIPVFAVMERFASVILLNCFPCLEFVFGDISKTASIFSLSPPFYLEDDKRFFAPDSLFSQQPSGLFMLVQVQADAGVKNDPFTELPVSLVLFSLICVDIVEKIRPLSRGLGLDFEMPGPVLTHSEQVTSVSRQLQANGRDGGASPRSPVRNGTISGHWRDADEEGTTRTSNTAYLYTSHSYSGPFRFVWIREPRHDLFVATFLFWFDTVEMVRVAGTDSVYYSAWVFPIYILAFLSFLRVVITPDSPLLASSSVLTQDLPFLVMRICLVAVFGYVTPVLYILKNIFTVVSFMYFNSRRNPYRFMYCRL